MHLHYNYFNAGGSYAFKWLAGKYIQGNADSLYIKFFLGDSVGNHTQAWDMRSLLTQRN